MSIYVDEWMSNGASTPAVGCGRVHVLTQVNIALSAQTSTYAHTYLHDTLLVASLKTMSE